MRIFADKRKVATMTDKIFVVTDDGPGDGGKGGVVHKITTMMHVHTVVKVGGAQGSHGVCTSRGERFAFSQWGCGTLEGIRTHISSQFVILPEGLLNEAEALRYQHGIYDVFLLLTIDESAFSATSFHGIDSRLKDLVEKHSRQWAAARNGEITVAPTLEQLLAKLGPESRLAAVKYLDPNPPRLILGVASFDPDCSPTNPHNREVARARGLRFDSKREAYVDREGALICDRFGQLY